jgi:hypothetical protein
MRHKMGKKNPSEKKNEGKKKRKINPSLSISA